MNTEFKEHLKTLIDADGGMAAPNLERISKLLRAFEETFTPQRLIGLLRGLPPTQGERRAISGVLQPESERWLSEIWLLEDEESRRLAKFSFRQMRSHVLAREFVDYAQSKASFRNENSSESETGAIHNEFRELVELEVENDVFELGC
jgi:hypothetical protein